MSYSFRWMWLAAVFPRRRGALPRILALFLLAFGASAHPTYWTSSYCSSHPTTARKGHGAPTQDGSISFTLRDSTGAVTTATTICPGNYTLQVRYPTWREALLTANQGSLGGTSACPNKRTYISQASSHTAQLTLSCSLTGTVKLQVTSASGSSDSYHQSSLTLTLNAASNCAACLGGGGGSPQAAGPSLTPSPSQGTSPGPSPSRGPKESDHEDEDEDEEEHDGNGGHEDEDQDNDGNEQDKDATPISGQQCVASDLGYNCSVALSSGVVLHYTAGGARPPNNTCTAGPQGSSTPATNASLLHLAIFSPLSGFVALSFADTLGSMAPATSVLGRLVDGAARVETYSLAGYSIGGPLSSSPALSAGVVSPSGGGLVLCLSVEAAGVPGMAGPVARRLLARGLAQTTSLGLDATALKLNYATDASSELSGHSVQGSLQLNAVGGSAAVAPASALASPTPPPTASGTDRKCASSSLGYACSAGVGGGVVLHWTAGGEDPPSNICTASGSTGTVSTTATSTASFVHFAITTRQSGYVALAFAAKSGRMSPATAIVGRLANGAASVEGYSISGYSIGTQMAPNQVAKSGVTSPSEGGLVLCFSVEAKNVPTGSGGGGGSGGGSGGASRRRGRALAQALEGLDSTALQLNWATDSSRSLSGHSNKGGLQLNAVTGGTAMAEADKELFVQVHGVLMSAAWVLLLPLGALTARHRWAAKGKRFRQPDHAGTGCCTKEAWFYTHVLLQLTGLGLFIASFVLALLKLEIEENDGPAGAHKVMGFVVAGMAGLQLLAAFIRPAPSAPRRPMWNMLHHNLGRATVLLSWATVFLGVYLGHEQYDQPLTAWLGPLVAVLATLVFLDVVLTLVRGPLLGAAAVHADTQGKALRYSFGSSIVQVGLPVLGLKGSPGGGGGEQLGAQAWGRDGGQGAQAAAQGWGR